MRRAAAISAPPSPTPARGGTGDAAADAGEETGAAPAPGSSVGVLEDMCEAGDLQVREAAPWR